MSRDAAVQVQSTRTSLSESEVEVIVSSLRSALNKVLRRQHPAEGYSFSRLYDLGFWLVLYRQGDRLLSMLKKVITEYLEEVRTDLLAASSDDFLATLEEIWDEFQSSMAFMSDFLMYRDRVIAHNSEEKTFAVGTSLFKEIVVCSDVVNARLRRAMLDVLLRIHRREHVEGGLMLAFRNVCQLLHQLRVDVRSVIEDYFDKHFLFRMSQRFMEVRRAFLGVLDRSDCLFLSGGLLKEEFSWIKLFVGELGNNVLDGVKEELMKKHEENVTEMEEEYPMEITQVEVVMEARNCIDKLLPVARSTSAVVKTATRIENLLQLKRAFDCLLADDSVGNDAYLRQAICAKFGSILNLGKDTPEDLAVFIDEALRKGACVDEAMSLLSVLNDKDAFEIRYQQLLSRRLLKHSLVSKELEQLMINNLKSECGRFFICKLEGMLKDLDLSVIANDAFQAELQQEKESDLSILVLTSGFWPLQRDQPSIILPTNSFDLFKKHYLSWFGDRTLTLLSNAGTADLDAFFFSTSTNARRHLLTVSTFQMCVLMLFNEKDCFTFEEIQKKTSIPERGLIRALQSLTRADQRILLKITSRHVTCPDEIEPTLHSFIVNDRFSSESERVTIQQVTLETKPTAAAADVKVDRRHEVEACVVRIMKEQRRMEHKHLAAEVAQRLAKRFRLSQLVLKQRIEALIDREYIRRSKHDMKVYVYLA